MLTNLESPFSIDVSLGNWTSQTVLLLALLLMFLLYLAFYSGSLLYSSISSRFRYICPVRPSARCEFVAVHFEFQSLICFFISFFLKINNSSDNSNKLTWHRIHMKKTYWKVLRLKLIRIYYVRANHEVTNKDYVIKKVNSWSRSEWRGRSVQHSRSVRWYDFII